MSRILIVEDDQTQLEMLRDVLEEKDHLVLIASKAEEGLKLFQDTKPELVIIDILMPGLDGLELLKQFKESSQNFKSVVLTGLNEDRCKQKAEELEADCYLVKPIDLEAFKSIIQNLLQSA